MDLSSGDIVKVIQAITGGDVPAISSPWRKLWTSARAYNDFQRLVRTPVTLVQQAEFGHYHNMFMEAFQGAPKDQLQYVADRIEQVKQTRPLAEKSIVRGSDFSNNDTLLQKFKSNLPKSQRKLKIFVDNHHGLRGYHRVAHMQTVFRSKVSVIWFVVNTNRVFDVSTDLAKARSLALKWHFEQVMEQVMDEMADHGRFITTWRVTRDGTIIPNVPWDNQTVRACKTSFKVEVGPINRTLHTHAYLGVQHYMMIKINGEKVTNFIRDELNRRNHTPGMPSFGDDLKNVFVGRFSVKHGSIASTYAQFLNYVSKEIDDNRKHWMQMQREVEAERDQQRLGIQIVGDEKADQFDHQIRSRHRNFSSSRALKVAHMMLAKKI